MSPTYDAPKCALVRCLNKYTVNGIRIPSNAAISTDLRTTVAFMLLRNPATKPPSATGVDNVIKFTNRKIKKLPIPMTR